MMAISPTNVYFSHFIRSDTFMVSFALLSLWASIRVFQQGATRHYVLAGIAAGLAASSKYPGALIVLSIVSAHVLRCGLQGLRDRRLYLALALSGAAFLVTTPFALLDHRTFLADMLSEVHHYSTGHPGMEGNSVGWYLAYLWRVEGILPFLALLEILRGILRHVRRTIFLSVFPMGYFSFISIFAVRNGQALLPLLPFVFLLALSLLLSLARWANARRSTVRTLALAAVGLLVLASLGLPLVRAVEVDRRLTTADSRETARVWIDQNLPEGARIALESYAPYVDPGRFSVRGFPSLIDHTPDWYAASGFEYLVFSEGMFARFYNDPGRYPDQVARYEGLFQAFDMVKVFTDGGYEVRILVIRR
jgi:4-amino-4-deoxy-L-arabinose transferase-like glycosyltransferase